MDNFAEKLYLALNPLLPSEWEKAVFRGIILPESCEFYFFCLAEGRYYGSRDLIDAGIFTSRDMNAAYLQIRKTARSILENKDSKWCSFTFTVNNEGSFSIDYEYDGESMISYVDWKNKYLT
jgi:hypothetical protein